LGRRGSLGIGLRPLIRALDLSRIVFGLFARAALHILLAEPECDREIHIGRAGQGDGLFDLLTRVAIDIKFGRGGTARLAGFRVRAKLTALNRIVDRIVEAVAQPDANRPVAAIRVDAAIDRPLIVLLLLLPP
jgi:hypothetical protein